jgi:hypothetical protein
MKVTHFKLVSGEEIIASVTDTTNPAYVLIKNARSIVVVQVSKNEFRLDFAPFLRANPDGEMQLMTIAIAAQADAHAELETAYLSQTSGLEIASSLSPLMG